MSELDRAFVVAANDAWVVAPEDSEVVETPEYRLVRLPERYTDPLQLQWMRSTRPAEVVLREVVERAVRFGRPDMLVFAKPGAPDDFAEALSDRGAELTDTADVLARALPAEVEASDAPELELRWRTTPEVARDANTIGTAVFGAKQAGDEVLARRAATDRETLAAGAGGAVVAYLDGTPVALAGVRLADGVARLWGSAVRHEHRGRGIYRALVAQRLAYATERNATMALARGRVATSSPILRRLGFRSYGQELTYRLPLGP